LTGKRRLNSSIQQYIEVSGMPAWWACLSHTSTIARNGWPSTCETKVLTSPISPSRMALGLRFKMYSQ
jgi:hypothetical protein